MSGMRQDLSIQAAIKDAVACPVDTLRFRADKAIRALQTNKYAVVVATAPYDVRTQFKSEHWKTALKTFVELGGWFILAGGEPQFGSDMYKEYFGKDWTYGFYGSANYARTAAAAAQGLFQEQDVPPTFNVKAMALKGPPSEMMYTFTSVVGKVGQGALAVISDVNLCFEKACLRLVVSAVKHRIQDGRGAVGMPPGLETGGRDDEETEEYVHDHDDYDDDDYDPDEMLDNYMHECAMYGVGPDDFETLDEIHRQQDEARRQEEEEETKKKKQKVASAATGGKGEDDQAEEGRPRASRHQGK